MDSYFCDFVIHCAPINQVTCVSLGRAFTAISLYQVAGILAKWMGSISNEVVEYMFCVEC